MTLRGFMFDLARLTERHEYYYEAVDFMADRGANLVVLHLSDHQGCAVRFAAHPDLATPYAFSPEELRAFVTHCEHRGVAVVPELECFGHAGYATNLPAYAHLGSDVGDAHFGAFFKPADPEVMAFLDDLLKETCEIFPHPIVHVGCDEVAIKHCAQFQDCSDEEKGSVFAQHIRALHKLVTARGKQMMLWGDMARKYPSCMDELPKDIILLDWDYRPDPSPAGMRLFREHGFRFWAAPAIVYGGEMVASSERCWRNLRSYCQSAKQEGAEGVVTTIWAPQRVLAPALWPAMAYAAGVMNDPDGFDGWRFWREYVGERFGLNLDNAVTLRMALEDLWRGMPHTGDFRNFWWSSPEALKRFRHAYEVWTARRLGVTGERCYRTLLQYRGAVRGHKDEFDALLLAARIMKHFGVRLELGLRWEVQALAEAEGPGRVSPSQDVMTSLRVLVEEDRALEAEVSAVWDQCRYPDDPKKWSDGGWPPAQVLLLVLRRGREGAETLLAKAGG